MKIKGDLTKIRIRFETEDVLELDKEDVKNFNCSYLSDTLDIHSKFDEYEASYIFLEVYKKSNKFINKGKLKGNLLLVFKKNIISWFEIYTTKTKYKIYPIQEIIGTEFVYDQNNKPLSQQKGYEDGYNVAQATVEYNSGDFAVIISDDIADIAYGDDYYD